MLMAAKKPKKLSDKQLKAVELLAKGYQIGMVVDAIQTSSPTIRNWKKLPEFKEALAEAINLKAETSNYKLHDLFRKALEEVEGLLQDRNPHVRLGAARLACESYSAIARAAAEQEMLESMEARMEQLAANMQTAQPILEAEDADFRELPPSDAK